MNPKLLSIIVPIYNTGNILNRCIDSLVNQTYEKLEIILVDDGSTDNSRSICNKWALQDSRIIVISSFENRGQAEARNIGMRQAHGEYIAFVDSDDYLVTNAYERMIYAIENDGSDMAICNFWNRKDNTGEKSIAYETMPIKTKREDIIEELFSEHLPTAAWCKVLKREVMIPPDNNVLWFPKGRRYEETVLSFKQVLASSKVSIIAEPLYFYTQSETTITANPKSEDIYNIIENTHEIRGLFYEEFLKESMECYITSTLVFALQLFYRSDSRNDILKKQILKEISESTRNISIYTAIKANKRKKILPCKFGIIDLIVKLHERRK